MSCHPEHLHAPPTCRSPQELILLSNTAPRQFYVSNVLLAPCQPVRSMLRRLADNTYDATAPPAFCGLLRPPSWHFATPGTDASPKTKKPHHSSLSLFAAQRLWQPLHAHCLRRPYPRQADHRLERHPDSQSHGRDQEQPFSCLKSLCSCRCVFLSSDSYHNHRLWHDAKLNQRLEILFLLKPHQMQLRPTHNRVIHEPPFCVTVGNTNSAPSVRNDVWVNCYHEYFLAPHMLAAAACPPPSLSVHVSVDFPALRYRSVRYDSHANLVFSTPLKYTPT